MVAIDAHEGIQSDRMWLMDRIQAVGLSTHSSKVAWPSLLVAQLTQASRLDRVEQVCGRIFLCYVFEWVFD